VSAALHLECRRGVSGGVLQLLYVLQCAVSYASARLQPLHALLLWRDEAATLALAVLLVHMSVVGFVLPLRLVMLLCTLALALHRTALGAAILTAQVDLLRHWKRGYEVRRTVTFPPSNVALISMAQQQAAIQQHSLAQAKKKT